MKSDLSQNKAKEGIMRKITRKMQNNPYVKQFKNIGTILKQEQLDEINLELLGFDCKYRSPKANQFSLFMPDSSDNSLNFDKFCQIKCKKTKTVKYTV